MEGVLRGAAMVFFAYIGFEAVSVAAQESKNPQRDMPIGMMLSLVVCTVLYIAMAAVMTGLVPFQLLGTDEPVVTAVAAHPQLGWLRWVVEVGALVGLSSVVLVMIIGQPRIFMIMGATAAAAGVHQDPPEVPHPAHQHGDHRHRHRAAGGAVPTGHPWRADLDGHADRVRGGVCRRADPAPHPAGPAAPFRMPMAWLICSLGVLSCLALLSAMTMHNWMLMGVWTFVGFGSISATASGTAACG